MSTIIGLIFIQVILGIILIAECYWYFGKKSAAGDLIKCVSTPMKRNWIKVVGYALIFLVWFYMRVMLMDIPYSQSDLICAVVLLAELIFAILFDHLPQQICMNGIITHRGYIPWETIEHVEECERPEVVQLKAGEKKGYFQQIFCCADEKMHIEEYVKARIDYIEEKDDEVIIEENEEKDDEVIIEENEEKADEVIIEESKAEADESIDDDEA